MADRAIERLNDLLRAFNKGSQVYKDLIGDATRDTLGWTLGTADLSSPIDLSVNYNLKLTVNGVTFTVDCRGSGVPPGSATTYAEIVSAINTAFGLTVASTATTSDGSRFLVLKAPVLAPPAVGSIVIATCANEATALILGLTVGNTYTYPDTRKMRMNDLNLGAISNALEYTRRFERMLIQFMNLANAEGVWLDFWLGIIYGIARPAGMTDDAYRTYGISLLFSMKMTPPAIRYALDRAFGATKYGDNVQIIEGLDDGMFTEVSFTDYYREFTVPEVVKSAILGETDGLPFFFRVIMENVDPADFVVILQIMESYRASGTTYIVEIVS